MDQDNGRFAVADGSRVYHKLRPERDDIDTITTYCGRTLGSWNWFDVRWHVLKRPPTWLSFCGLCQRTELHKLDVAIRRHIVIQRPAAKTEEAADG